jgi:drug/metabolite transporter (DMT)-like permease
MTRGASIISPFGVGAVVTALIALAFWLDRRFRLFSFLGTAILVITGAALLVNPRVIPLSVPVEGQQK